MAKRRTERVLVIPDIHRDKGGRGHDSLALECLFQGVEQSDFNETVMLGDMVNCDDFSTHPKSALTVDPEDFYENELLPVIRMFEFFADNGITKIVAHEGNHEYRPERWCAIHDKASLFSLVSPRRVFTDAMRNVCEFQWIPYKPGGGLLNASGEKNYYEIFPHDPANDSVGLVSVHGWSFAENAAKIHLAAARGRSMIYGHTHRADMKGYRCPFTGRRIKAWSPGCLADLNPEYWGGRKPTEWTHGFSVVHRGHRSWRNFDVEIDNGYCVLEGGVEIDARKRKPRKLAA